MTKNTPEDNQNILYDRMTFEVNPAAILMLTGYWPWEMQKWSEDGLIIEEPGVVFYV